MDIKIQCRCGQKIAFDVEPENGEMPCPLPCPSCDADCTGMANEQIREQLAAQKPVAPAPVVPSAEGAPRMRISVSPAAHPPTPPSEGAAPVAAEAPQTPAASGRPKPVPLPAPPTGPARGADGEATVGVFLLGTVGVFGGAIVGLILWFLIAKMGLNLRILAVLVGAGAGLGARVFCREGDKSLGGVAAVIAVIGMFIGGPLILDQKLRIPDEILREAYQGSVETAKRIVAEIPNRTDAEITKYLAKEAGGAQEVTPEDISAFREDDDFKYARELASGKRSYETYAAAFRRDEDKVHKEVGGAIAGFGAMRMLSLWLIGLVGGTAYKIAAG